jgi:hypothetical protein
MKNLDELTLLFPEMEQKRQESTLGGDTYPGGGGGVAWSGTYDPGVTIYAPPITPPDPYPTPGFNTGGSGDNGGGGGGDGSSTPATGTPLHPEIVSHLMNTFKFNPLSINPTEKANFEKTLNAIDSSQAGDKMLTALDNYYKNHTDIVPPTITHNPADPGSEGTFRASKNEYDFGTLLNDNNALLSWDLKTVAHEMYHNFQYTVAPDQYANNPNREADAFLFDALVQKQANVDFNASAMETRIEVQNPTTQAQKDFNTAWNNFVNNGDASQSNYNLIVNNFFAGSAVGSGYTFTAPISTNEPQFLKDLGFPPSMGDGNNPTNPNPYQH